MKRVRFIGLGAMGWPMAARLAGAGWTVEGADAHADTERRWAEAFGSPAPTLQGTDAALVCVSDEAASRAVVEGLLGTAPPGLLIVDHSTTSAAWAREADERARAAGLRWCDAPLSGGVQGAERGELVAMLGAHAADLPLLRALLQPMTRQVVHLGPPGSGQLCKLAHQLALAGVAAGLAEAQAFGREAGLDLEQVFEVLSLGTAASAQLQRLRATLAEPGNDARRSFAWLDKDLQACAAAGKRRPPLVTLWQDLWKDAP